MSCNMIGLLSNAFNECTILEQQYQDSRRQRRRVRQSEGGLSYRLNGTVSLRVFNHLRRHLSYNQNEIFKKNKKTLTKFFTFIFSYIPSKSHLGFLISRGHNTETQLLVLNVVLVRVNSFIHSFIHVTHYHITVTDFIQVFLQSAKANNLHCTLEAVNNHDDDRVCMHG